MKTNEKPNKETLNEWHNDPSNWKFGVFYFNKKDNRIFPPKRTRLGWTINFANPISIFVILSIIAILIVLSEYQK
jgi:uncharacterized membrane protein